jgi:tetratricopeptide (TPR) repeat protein
MKPASRVLTLLPAAALLLGLCGCAADREQAALEAYEAGQYREAIAAASPGARSNERLALIAGLSAQAAEDNTRAVVWLRPLRDSADPQIRGRALAGLGLVALQEGRHADAAALLQEAASSLDGAQAARAMLLAGDASRKSGQEAQARSYYQIARVRAGGEEPISAEIARRLGAPAAQ